MSNDQNFGIGGRNIIPTARKSIHSHPNCIFNRRREMGRIGKDSSEDEGPGATAEVTDEVDNVLSKMSHPSSSLLMKKARGTSLTPQIPPSSEDSDRNTLAKSLPATLPSRSNYSEEAEAWQAECPTIMNHLKAKGAMVTPLITKRSGNGRNSSYVTRSPNQIRLNEIIYRKQETKSIAGTMLLSCLVLMAIAGAVYYEPFKRTIESDHVYDELRFHSDLIELGAKYKVGDDSILQLQAGISTVYKRKDTSCLIFFYNSMSEDFDLIKFDGFVNNIASKAAKFLRNETASVRHMVVEGSDLKMRSPSQLIKQYRDDVVKTGVLLIRDVEHVPSPLAMAFHYYCDEYNPLVKKSAIFFTLNSAKCHNSGEKSSHAAVEKCLKEKWSTVPKDNIGPLLTRVVSIVVDVTSGF